MVRASCCAPSIVTMALLTLGATPSVHLLQTFGKPHSSDAFHIPASKTF